MRMRVRMRMRLCHKQIMVNSILNIPTVHCVKGGASVGFKRRREKKATSQHTLSICRVHIYYHAELLLTGLQSFSVCCIWVPACYA